MIVRYINVHLIIIIIIIIIIIMWFATSHARHSSLCATAILLLLSPIDTIAAAWSHGRQNGETRLPEVWLCRSTSDGTRESNSVSWAFASNPSHAFCCCSLAGLTDPGISYRRSSVALLLLLLLWTDWTDFIKHTCSWRGWRAEYMIMNTTVCKRNDNDIRINN